MSLRNRLSILVGLALLPPIGLLGYDTIDMRAREKRQLFDQAQYQSQLVAGQLDAIIQGTRRLSWALAHQTRVRTDPLRCSELMRDLITETPLYRAGIVTDATGRVVCSWPKVPPNVSLGDRDYVQRALRTPEMVVGTLIARGRITGASALPLARRYLNDTEVGGVVVLGLDLDLLSRSFRERYGAPDRYISVLDAENRIIVRVPGAEELIGRQMDSAALAPTGDHAAGSFEGRDAQGRRAIIGYTRGEGFLVSVGYDAEAALAQLDASTWRNAILMALALLLALAGAWISGERLLRRPITGMVRAARRLEAGERDVRFPDLDPATELGGLAHALNRMAEANRQLLGQREILMRELQHRVMNSLQLLASVLRLQARNADPAAREHLAVARERIVSMSTIFRYLYRAELASTIEFGSFLEAFCRDTAKAYLDAGSARIEVKADRQEIALERALSLALIAHELITNAIKHAFPAGPPGRIDVAYRVRADGGSELAVTDNGAGLPPGFDPTRTASLGMLLIQRLAQSLDAKLAIDSSKGGTSVTIAMPPEAKA